MMKESVCGVISFDCWVHHMIERYDLKIIIKCEAWHCSEASGRTGVPRALLRTYGRTLAADSIIL